MKARNDASDQHSRPPHGLLGFGLSLLLALPAQAQQGPEPSWNYRIQPGDTLIALSNSYLDGKHGWRDLQRLNRVADPLKLPPGGTLRMPVAWLQREAGVARVQHVQGEVGLLRPPASTELPLTQGSELRSGDRLRTGPQSSVSLRFADGSRLLVTPGSSLTLEQLLVYGRGALPATQLRLDQGGADSRVQPDARQPPRYELRTPSVNLGVRGTEFRVQIGGSVGEAGRTRVQVLEGTVAAGSQPLKAGEGAVAVPGQALQLKPLLDAPDLRLLPAVAGQLPLTLAWAPQHGASAYRAQVFAEADFERLLLDGVFSAPQASWVDSASLADGRYSLRVRAIDALGLEGRAADAVFTLKARPEPPYSRAPAPEAEVYGAQAALSWTRAPAARRYRLQLAATPDFAAPLVDRSDLSGTAQDLTLPPGAYHWRLASIAEGEDQGPFGPVQTFSLRPEPPSPAVAAPELGDEELLFRWQAQPGMRYQLQWSPDAEFKQSVGELDSAEPQARLPRPPAGTYHLRVRSVDASGHAGAWGGTQQFDVPRSRWFWLLPAAALLLLAL